MNNEELKNMIGVLENKIIKDKSYFELAIIDRAIGLLRATSGPNQKNRDRIQSTIDLVRRNVFREDHVEPKSFDYQSSCLHCGKITGFKDIDNEATCMECGHV